MKIGVLGGTFDPVQRGHIMVAESARDSLSLDCLLMVPAGQPPFKGGEPVTPAEHRLAMLRLAVAGMTGVEVSTVEIERPGPSYTVDTIAALRERYGDRDEIYFIVGWDSLGQFPGWREPERILGMCKLAAVPRPGWERPDMRKVEKKLPGISQRVVLLDKPHVDISASAVREMVADGKSIGSLVPGSVAEYIKEHSLYKKQGGTS
ncbi:MAG: nicotinate (nicotinamide) nucleotide adenylyltransferase [Dehalococcoidales bacterium]|nr:nicotinate (nicotinamide) nucleotide adenylyltransferase [Dehalococcoidales bacterium]